MKSLPVCFLILFALLLQSCDSGNPAASSSQLGATSRLNISFLMKDASPAIAKIAGVLSRSGHETISKQFTISNDTASCEFENIPTGSWHLRVDAYDGNDSLQFSGQTDVEVYPGQTTPVSITLDPTTGSIIVTVTWGKSTLNHALLFNEDGGSVRFAPSTAFHLQALTVEMYVQVNNTDTILVPFLCETNLDELRSAEGFSVKWEQGILYFRVAVKSNFADVVCSPYSFKRSTWVHLACTYDHEALRLYVNGDLFAQKPYSATIYYGRNGFSLGSAVHSSFFGGTHYLGGMMDEIRIWNYARSQEQIKQTMKQVLLGSEPGLVGYWNCEQGTYGAVLYDKTGFHHDGALFGNVSFALSNTFSSPY